MPNETAIEPMMSDPKTNASDPNAQPTGSAPAPTPEGAAAGATAPPAEGPSPTLEIVKLEAQIKDLTDRLLRAHAEMDNMRKRAERERDETAKFAITKFARDIVGVSDNFQRAISAVPPGAAAEDAALKALLDGVTMTEREFLNVLERHGIRKIDPVGEVFSPHRHQAMMEMENLDVAAGTILQVYQAGYVIEDRVIRPAMVVVAKGGAKPGKPAGNGNEPS